MGRAYGSVRVRFDYEIYPRKHAEFKVGGDFDHCSTFEELMTELLEQAPDGEWSVHPSKDDAQKLWEMIQSQRAAESS